MPNARDGSPSGGCEKALSGTSHLKLWSLG